MKKFNHLHKFNENSSPKDIELELFEEIREICRDFTDNGYQLICSRDEDFNGLYNFRLKGEADFIHHEDITIENESDIKKILQITKDKAKDTNTFNENIEALYDRVMDMEEINDYRAIESFEINFSFYRIDFAIWHKKFPMNKISKELEKRPKARYVVDRNGR